MKIRSLFVLTIIAALLGMATACDDFLKDPNSTGTDNDLPGENPNLQPDSQNYTVSFAANGGSPAPQNQTVSHGGKATEPAAITKAGYDFGGWYKEVTLNNQWDFDNDTVTANITLYANWYNYDTFYTVSFEANGGSPAPQSQTVRHGDYVNEPAYMTKTGYGFGGWYKEADCINQWNFYDYNQGNFYDYDYVTANITLYAKWVIPRVVTGEIEGETLADKLRWVNSNAESHNTYILEVNNDEFLGPNTLSYSGKSNITIQIKGIGDIKTLDLYGSGSFFTIGNNVTLILENIVLNGKSDNRAPLVRVQDGNLIMNNGSKITGNGNTSSYDCGGVYVEHGTFTMNGGEISGNTGGGVFVRNYNYDTGATFTMNGGKISGNTVSSYYSDRYGGGGVYVYGGTFTMNGGEISGNTVSSYYSDRYGGGGVYVYGGTFTMTGGVISGNTVSGSYNNSCGGGVYVYGGTFTMTDGEISDNTSSYGGGVYVGRDYYRGYVTFTMTGGEISDNTASSYGGGVCISDSTSFEKIGGIITGYSSDAVNGNVVKDSNGDVLSNSGHAVYVENNTDSRFIRYKDTTAVQGNNLKYIRNEPNPPTISGAWDE